MDEIERAIRLMRRRREAREIATNAHIESLPGPAFRALVTERLRVLERDVAEARTRTNGVIFVVAGAVITQLVLRLL